MCVTIFDLYQNCIAARYLNPVVKVIAAPIVGLLVGAAAG
jgi:hypothetical protein